MNWWQVTILGLTCVVIGGCLVYLVLARAYARIEAQWQQTPEEMPGISRDPQPYWQNRTKP